MAVGKDDSAMAFFLMEPLKGFDEDWIFGTKEVMGKDNRKTPVNRDLLLLGVGGLHGRVKNKGGSVFEDNTGKAESFGGI